MSPQPDERQLTPLPIIQSCPHGGLAVPKEVADRLAIDATTIYNECDLWVDQLFDFGNVDLVGYLPPDTAAGTLAVVNMDIARVLIDANRPPDSLTNPDGAVKSRTSYGHTIYTSPLTPDTQELLLDRYWRAYHAELDRAFTTHAGVARLFLDCHNMAQAGPAAYADAGAARPLICLANFGDEQGEAIPGRPQPTCPPVLLRAAGAVAAEIFADLLLIEPDAVPPPVVALNQPFAGGYILQKGTARLTSLSSRPIPGIMIEVNRGLFVGNQSPDTPPTPPDAARIADLRRRLYQWSCAVVGLLDKDDDV